MHTGDYIRSVKFDKSMSGYKVADVEIFLDEVAEDFDKLVEENKILAAKIKELQEGGSATKPPVVDNSDSIQNVQSILVSAQRFSDQIINEANEKAAAILEEANNKAKEIDEKVAAVLNAFENDIAERKSNADNEISTMLKEAAVKSEGIITAAHDSVARQQMLFDKLKIEVSEFKKALFDNHKKQLEIIQKFPDSVPYDPEHAAKALEFLVDSEPDFSNFIPTNDNTFEEPEEELQEVYEPVEELEETVKETTEDFEEPAIALEQMAIDMTEASAMENKSELNV